MSTRRPPFAANPGPSVERGLAPHAVALVPPNEGNARNEDRVASALPRSLTREGKSRTPASASQTRSATSLSAGRCTSRPAVAGNRRSESCHDTTERSLSANASKKRSAGKSITPVLSPNRLSEWWWESMAHSLKQGRLGRAKGISLRFSPGAWRPRSAAARHSPWCGTWIRMQRGGCKPFSGAAVEDKTRI